MARSGRRGFEYFTPDYDKTVQMAESRGLGYDTLYKEQVKLFKPRSGVNMIRILPAIKSPLWPDPDYYGLAVRIHTDVGPNNRQYLCLKENAQSPHRRCPICDALYDLGAKATQEERLLLRAKLSYLFYIVDREAPGEGVQLWRTSAKNMSEIAVQSVHRRNKSVLPITDPEVGYDVEFTRVGEGRLGTRYQGFMVVREESPLSDSERRQDDWLNYVKENPLPAILNFYSPEYIEEALHGRSRDEDRPRQSVRSHANGEDEDERPLRRTREETRDEDDEEDTPPPRARVRDRQSEDDDDAERETRPARRRTQLSRDLDDEIPENDAEEEAEPPKQTRDRPRLVTDDDDSEPQPRRRVRRTDDDDDEAEQERARARVRDNLDRRPPRR